MIGLAEGMEKIVRNIQSSREQRKAKVSELRSDSNNLIERFGLEHRDMARALKNKMNSDENVRIEVARQAREQRKAKVSELRSDSHNLIERFGLERRDMALALKNKLNSDKNARRKVTQHETEQRKAKVNTGIEKVNKLRSELAADFRKARSIWSEVKKNFPRSR